MPVEDISYLKKKNSNNKNPIEPYIIEIVISTDFILFICDINTSNNSTPPMSLLRKFASVVTFSCDVGNKVD